MKKTFLSTLLILILLGVGGYFLYRTLMPQIVAEAMVAESLPAYIPKRLKTKVEAIRKPLNKGTEAIIVKMHSSQIPMDQVLEAVDNIEEDEAYAFLDEVNRKKPSTTNEFFDIAKKHMNTDFDLEVFREPFNKHFQMKQVNNAIKYANINRKSNDVELATVKAILKRIIIDKEQEMVKTQTSH